MSKLFIECMSEGMKRKLVSVKIDTVKRLIKYGAFGESFDDVLNKILDELEGKKKKD